MDNHQKMIKSQDHNNQIGNVSADRKAWLRELLTFVIGKFFEEGYAADINVKGVHVNISKSSNNA